MAAGDTMWKQRARRLKAAEANEIIIEQIREILWLDAADGWDPDKEWDSDTLERIADVLTSAGLRPADRD